MYVVVVRIQIVAGREDDFIAASQANASGTRQEPGNLRWDLLRHTTEPDRFSLYEAYGCEADFTAHQQTEHYLRWKEEVAPMMAVPRTADRYRNLTPWE